jgi:hypothetical protein
MMEMPSLKHLRKQWMIYNPQRLMFFRKYPNNTRWRGYLSPLAISELELAGNTVQRRGDHYVLNSTEPARLIKTRLLGIIQEPSGVLL